MFNQTTPQLIQLLTAHLAGLGIAGVTAHERWEGDGVFVIGPPPADPARHWYVWVSGTDNDGFEPGATLVIITGRPTGDVTYVLKNLVELNKRLAAWAFLPAA